MREGLPCLFCYLRYLTDKVINDSDFLYFLSINLFDFSHQNFADEPVQHHFIQFFNGCIVPDFFATMSSDELKKAIKEILLR